MSAVLSPPVDPRGPGERERVERWRFEQLRRAGYERSAAAALALRPDVDLHLAARLLRAGCPRETALRILL